METSGFIVIRRSIKNWRYWGCETAMALWLCILTNANWKDGWFQGAFVPRGSFITSGQALAAEVGCHPNTIRKWLKRFADEGQIELKSTNKWTLISVINYAKYQDCPDDSVTQIVTQDVTQDGEQGVNQCVNQCVNQSVNNRTRITKKQGNKGTKSIFVPPTTEEVEAYCRERMNTVDAERFVDFYSSKNWMVGKNRMSDWKAAVRNWERQEQKDFNKSPQKREEHWTF